LLDDRVGIAELASCLIAVGTRHAERIGQQRDRMADGEAIARESRPPLLASVVGRAHRVRATRCKELGQKRATPLDLISPQRSIIDYRLGIAVSGHLQDFAVGEADHLDARYELENACARLGRLDVDWTISRRENENLRGHRAFPGHVLPKLVQPPLEQRVHLHVPGHILAEESLATLNHAERVLAIRAHVRGEPCTPRHGASD
jgi:hypothetical protein